ncbi:hypothetical protein ACWEPC_09025 [Nonomuraea sp. NPDC004297]
MHGRQIDAGRVLDGAGDAFVQVGIEGIGYEEIGRGRWSAARPVWTALVTAHDHMERTS